MRSPGGTVLGKRPRKLGRATTASAMDEDTPVREEDGYVMVPSPPVSPRHARKASEVKDQDGDVSMRTATPHAEAKSTALEQPMAPIAPRDDEMMFGALGFHKFVPRSAHAFLGRQHDVAECMDNCMFQIETALLRFDGSGGPESSQDIDKTSVVKRYGTFKYRSSTWKLTLISPVSSTASYARESWHHQRMHPPEARYTKRRTCSHICL